jgi:type IV secretion system protein VirB5
MFKRFSRCVWVCLTLSLAAAPAARAQWAVVDVGAINQLIQEVRTMSQQLMTAEAQLQQAKNTLQSMSGGRGMQTLLSGTNRNYLPTSSGQLTSAMQGGGSYPGLTLDIRNAVNANAVLTPTQLAALSPADQQQITAARQAAALRQALAQEALANSSSRFAALQSLISAIGTATDQKGILDLQARITAELGMLQNEQTKLQVLSQAGDALTAANAQRDLELSIAEQGRFETRFQPAP